MMRYRFFNLKYFLPAIIFLTLSLYQCGDDNSTEPTPPTVIKIVVKSGADSSVVSGANVVLYNANSGESVGQEFSASDGIATFQATFSGNYYVRIAAQGFKELPEIK